MAKTAKPPKAAKGRPRAVPGARQRAAAVVELLGAEYPQPECALVHSSPFELLVATILSAQTTDEQVNSVTPRLFARFPGSADLAGAPLGEVEEIIHPTGFFRMKARAIVEMSQDLVTHHGGEVPPRMEDLVLLRGVGRKTANVVLGVAFGVPGFPVDTHVTRLSGRLRLTRSIDPVRIEADVCALVPASEWTELSLRLILHGRRVCDARSPRCTACVLAEVCPSAGSFTRPSRSRPSRPKPKARVRPRSTAVPRSHRDPAPG